jgi:hypothetical protein
VEYHFTLLIELSPKKVATNDGHFFVLEGVYGRCQKEFRKTKKNKYPLIFSALSAGHVKI